MKITYFLLIWLLCSWPAMVFSQDEQEKVLDELGDVNDAFQNFFFEALKQKAIENYDRAIEWLEKAAKESP
ncbi:MAG TPA: hypothetical protein VKZ42_06080, partial [Flavobacteriaceae bacterium]|nr:hypothetical protein [Flavobacteriaceae bacterium]